MEKVKRFIPDERGSFFLFGPRGTGKTTWLNEHFPDGFYLDPREKTENRQRGQVFLLRPWDAQYPGLGETSGRGIIGK